MGNNVIFIRISLVMTLTSMTGCCQLKWATNFHAPGIQFAGNARAAAIFDDGTGPAVYVGGYFASAGSARAKSIAKWNGNRWIPMGEGIDGTVSSLIVFDDGQGQQLYVGGNFRAAGGVPARNIARWNGKAWSALGNGTDDAINAMAVFDDGNGPALFVGGSFETAGDQHSPLCAKWSGSGWEELSGGLHAAYPVGSVREMAVFDDGHGTALYVVGNFTEAGGTPAEAIARWNGTAWSPVIQGPVGSLSTVCVFDDGRGDALYVGGGFIRIGDLPANRVARWDGATWSALDTGTDGHVNSLAVFNDANGPGLYAGGHFTRAGTTTVNRIAKWDGVDWTDVGGGVRGGMSPENPSVSVLTPLHFRRHNLLLAAGDFALAGNTIVNHIATWNGEQWLPLGNGNGISADPRVALHLAGVEAACVYDDGKGEALYVGGAFGYVGNVPAAALARWDGDEWHPIDGGVDGVVRSLAVCPTPNGSVLVVGGYFQRAGALQTNNIAAWNGQSWQRLGTGLNGEVQALAVYDDGWGPALYAAGEFSNAGDQLVQHVARWDGRTWTPLGTGMNGHAVNALVVYDDGTGPALYAGGDFDQAGGVTARRLAKWDGVAWTEVGGGLRPAAGFRQASVQAMAVFQPPKSTPLLCVGGFFGGARGINSPAIIAWNGNAWLGLQGGIPHGRVEDLTVFTRQNKPALFLGGFFQQAGDVAAANIASWDGKTWSAVEGGTDGPVHALCEFSTGRCPSLYVGGQFFFAGDNPAARIARWGPPR